MYKTVRHGENSLQYTILPQTEEVLNSSGIKGKGRDYSPSIHVRRRKRSVMTYVWFFLLATVIAVAISAGPIYVMNGAFNAKLAERDREIAREREIITNSPLTPTGREIVKSRKKELKITPEIISKIQSISTTTTSTTSTTTLPPTTEKATTAPLQVLPAIKYWKSSTSTTIKPYEEVPLAGTPSGSIRMLDRFTAKILEDLIIRPSTEPLTPVTIRDVFRYYSQIPTEKIGTVSPKILEDVLITSKVTSTSRVTTELTTQQSKLKDLKEAILSVDDDEDFKESLEVDEVFSLPPLKPETSDGEVTVSKAGDWYAARWPFVDTSSYFQWSSYSQGDNLLLPLLVGALCTMALLLLLTVAVYSRKRSLSSAQLGLPPHVADDNTNLLPSADNPDEGEAE